MRKILFISTALLSLWACADNHETPQYGDTLIIYYDGRIGPQPLLDTAVKRHFPVLYRYRNFDVVAIGVPHGEDMERVMWDFEKVTGVLQVNRDQLLQLH